MYLWKQDFLRTIFKCQSDKCPFYLKNLAALTPEEHKMRAAGNTSQFKLRYQYREYHFNPQDLQCARPAFPAKTDLFRIRNNSHVLSMALSYFINIGLSSRQTREALLKIHDIKVSHQTIINYANSAASLICNYVDQNSPKPKGIVAGDETYIVVEGRMQYTWFNIEASTRAGFKTFEGAVCLTVLFVAFYNFMRSHSALGGNVPVPLDCLEGVDLYPRMWSTLLQQAA